MEKFEFKGFEFRVIERDGEPWFVAKDVCDVLGLGHQGSALRHLEDDERGVLSMHTPGGDQQVSVINEPGLYSLILRSRKERAREFKRWVVHEVLPTIRKTGGDYNAPESPVSLAHQLGDAEGVAALLEANSKALNMLRDQLSETRPRATAGYGAEATKGGQTVWDMRYAISEALGIGVQEVHKVLGMCGFYERRESGHFTIRERHRDILFETPVQVGDKTYNSGPPRVRPGKQDEFLSRVREAYAFRFGVTA